jgi:glycosyltransferase involved in cell wall biosynthesis
VTTLGVHSDDILRREAGTAFAASPNGDASAFAARAAELATDPDARRRMRPASRRLYAEEFAFDRASARLLDLLATFDKREVNA